MDIFKHKFGYLAIADHQLRISYSEDVDVLERPIRYNGLKSRTIKLLSVLMLWIIVSGIGIVLSFSIWLYTAEHMGLVSPIVFGLCSITYYFIFNYSRRVCIAIDLAELDVVRYDPSGRVEFALNRHDVGKEDLQYLLEPTELPKFISLVKSKVDPKILVAARYWDKVGDSTFKFSTLSSGVVKYIDDELCVSGWLPGRKKRFDIIRSLNNGESQDALHKRWDSRYMSSPASFVWMMLVTIYVLEFMTAPTVRDNWSWIFILVTLPIVLVSIILWLRNSAGVKYAPSTDLLYVLQNGNEVRFTIRTATGDLIRRSFQVRVKEDLEEFERIYEQLDETTV